MRLTGDVILKARVLVNPLRERELDLRGTPFTKGICSIYVNEAFCALGYKIPTLENLGATKVLYQIPAQLRKFSSF